MNAMNKEYLKNYFDLLDTVLEENYRKLVEVAFRKAARLLLVLARRQKEDPTQESIIELLIRVVMFPLIPPQISVSCESSFSANSLSICVSGSLTLPAPSACSTLAIVMASSAVSTSSAPTTVPASSLPSFVSVSVPAPSSQVASTESFQLISSIASGSNPPLLDEAAACQDSADEDCECAFCYVCYCQDGKEWVRCYCSCWFHEECVQDVLLDGDSQVQFCPFSLNKFTPSYFLITHK